MQIGLFEPKDVLTYKKEDDSLVETRPLKVLSLFSGCGGFDLGFIGGFKFRQFEFEKNNFEVVFANDIEKNAVKVYDANDKYLKHSAVLNDVREIDDKEFPEFDIMLAGFPCQPFSSAGNRKGIEDENGRGTLFYECERIIKSSIAKGHRPKGFVFENVRGILSSKMHDGTSIPNEIVKKMDKMGYKTVYKLLKSSDYGVPENRFRVIFIGVDKKYPAFDFDLLNTIVRAYNLPTAETNPYELYLGSILSDIPEDAPQRHDYWKFSPSGQYMIDKIEPCVDGEEVLEQFRKKIPVQKISETIQKGRSWKNMNPDEMPERFRKIWDNPKKYRAPNFYRRFALGEICGTIIASGQPENSGITHTFENRRFSIREIARIQSFPDDFVFPYSSIPHAYKVIGNAVPPVMAWVLAKALEYYFENQN